MVIEPLRKRADFLALRSAPSVGTPSFRLVRAVGHGDRKNARVGYTITKKVGNAVTRNRIRRRLKNVVNRVFPLQAEANADYVVIAYRLAFDRPFDELLGDMEKALLALQAGKGKKRN